MTEEGGREGVAKPVQPQNSLGIITEGHGTREMGLFSMGHVGGHGRW